MTPTEAFAALVEHSLNPAKAQRFTALASSKKGRRKVLDALSHEFDPAIRPDVIRKRNYDRLWNRPCFVYQASRGFGIEFATVRAAYDELAADDSWLIVVSDGSAGIYRPEARWDEEKLIAG